MGATFPPDEVRALLAGAGWAEASPSGLTAERLRQLSRERGIDAATALLYASLLRTEPHASWNRRLATRLDGGPSVRPKLAATLVIVPGAFWREYPATGVGGEVLEGPARALGMRVERIPVGSRGRLQQNARTILDWLARSRAERIVLASLSKGGADVRAALATPEAREAFARVQAWVDLSGIVCGTPMVEWFMARPLRRLLLRLGLCLKGIDPGFLAELGSLRHPPPEGLGHLHALHVAGFALRRHCSSPRSRRWWTRLAVEGPTDGVVRLADVVALPGIVVPIWGADHYLRPLVQDARFALAVLSNLAEDLDASAGAPAREAASHGSSSIRPR